MLMMNNWLVDLVSKPSIAQTVILIAATIAGGIALGKLKLKGVSLGVTWVLFFGILIGQFDFIPLDNHVLHFVKEFGLILFIYSIGLQVGPSFFSSFQQGGVQQNLLAVGIVVTGCLVAFLLSTVLHIDLASMVGILSGAVTNTPGLGAAQQTYTDLHSTAADFLSAGYAIAYPMGVMGVIFVCIVLNKIFKNNVQEANGEKKEEMDMFAVELSNSSCDGITLGSLKEILNFDFVVTRLYHTHSQFMEVPSDESQLSLGDRLFIVCKKSNAPKVEMCTGARINMESRDWEYLDKNMICKKITLTKSDVNGKTLGEINFRKNYNVNISRIIRADVSIFPSDSLQLVLGDILVVVGNEEGIQKASNFVGNNKGKLCDPFLIPIFLGIMLGVILGSIPFPLPLIPVPVKLGLAGGPLIVAILMSRYGTQFGIVTYATHSAKKMLQEMGISLFLAAVGLSSGKIFFATLMEHGSSWFLCGTLITLVPIILAAIIGRFVCKFDSHQLMGLISGSMTDPAALAFANSITEGKAALSYATVYPLTMFMRILTAQILILLSV